ncbi:uncharacterized protein LOC133711345 [Rosa rugosa]|uniref:uncharacterized protein LOC133711345 n=1 Tax=Rosa rugosa TaxID=74645 RepID=UPI002B40C7DC|nr:uncharacterized protein LOC133711345 [Rosa rugosa]
MLNSEDDDYDPQFDKEIYDDYGVDDDDWLGGMECEFNNMGQWIGGGSKGNGASMESEGDVQVEDNEAMHGAVDSDEEVIGNEANSDGEDFPEFHPKTDMHDLQFCLGMKFATAKILRAAIRERDQYKKSGKLFFFVKSDRLRIRMICKAENCPFELYASKMQHEDTLIVKTYNEEHTCARVNENSMIRTPYLTEKFAEQIKFNPNCATDSLAQSMSASLKARVSVQQAYREKKGPLQLLEASIREKFARIWDYGEELKRVDPNTTIDLKCDFDNPEQLPVFKRLYICLGALKMSFRAGYRSVLGFDGCHLKSCYGGQLLTAVGLDANNTTGVLAYAMVEMKSKDSWEWFLDLLVKDLNIRDEGGWTFISDKQKGLLPAFEEIVPLADLRFCVRHLWTNFIKLFPGKVMKDQFWACAKATTINYFTKEMILMKLLDLGAYDWLTARAKPIVTCFEEIRVNLMKRIHIRRDKMLRYEDTIYPKPRKILEKNKVKAATDCIPSGLGGPEIEVESFGGSKHG